MNLMIFTPWGDQGLGIQSREYCINLSKLCNVYILSSMPYLCKDNEIYLQKNPDEWTSKYCGYSGIYYSFNGRKDITKSEIKKFVRYYRIDCCIIPEISWDIFEKVEWMREEKIKVVGIPNIEIIYREDVPKLFIFDKIFCNTKLCYDLLSPSISKEKICYIGHPIKPRPFCEKPNNKISFVAIGGYNSITRKNIPFILREFEEALQIRDDIFLTITTTSEKFKSKSQNITIIEEALTHEQIYDLYQSSHVSIQVSLTEGLGLGFYESLACWTPVITMNVVPYNEIINEGNGWFIEHTSHSTVDNNPSPLVKSYSPVENSLKNLLLSITLEDVTLKKPFIEQTFPERSEMSFYSLLFSNL